MRKLLLLIIVLAFCSCHQDIPFLEKKPTLIGIQAFGDFNPAHIDTVKQVIQNVYGFQVVLLPKKELPNGAFVNIKSPRYRADSLLRFLKKRKPDTIDFVIGLTHKDISTTKRTRLGQIKEPASRYSDWGIFGLGYRPGPACVVSTYRLSRKNKAAFFTRLKKISVHELGHNMGLRHCKSDKCVMRDAEETINTIDYVDLSLCSQCSKRIE